MKKDTSDYSTSTVSELEKTAPSKKSFRINNKTSIAVGTDDRIKSGTLKPLPPNQAVITAPVMNESKKKSPSSTFRLTDIDKTMEAEGSAQQSILNILQKRVKDDKVTYEEFMENAGLMKYYDRLWEIGVDSLEALAKVSTEDYNHLLIPAGGQIKIEKELKKVGIDKETPTREIAIGTAETDQSSEAGRPKEVVGEKRKKLNFKNMGIKMKQVELNLKPAMVTMECGTDCNGLEAGDNIPLNVETENRSNVFKKNETESIKPKGILKKTCEVTPNTREIVQETQVQLQEIKHPISFSFACLGGTSFSLNHVEFADSGTDADLSPPQTSSALNQIHPKAVNIYRSSKVSCFSCLKLLTDDEAFTHKLLQEKYFCSKNCLEQQSELLIRTCPVCYNAFEKAKGVPTSELAIWACSEACKKNYNPKLSDKGGLSEAIRAHQKREAELQYQMDNQGAHVDLDFSYEYS